MMTGISKNLNKNLTELQLEYIARSGFSGETFSNYKHRGAANVVQGFSDLDKVQKYSYNSSGYRCKEFEKTPYLLCSGDSNTFGVGLPEKATWPHMLSQNISNSLSPINLALPGASVESIVDDVFHYIKKYGPPKNLFIVFPDFCRGLFFSNPKILAPEKAPNELGPSNVLLGHLIGKDEERPFISKRPHSIEDVISIEQIYVSAFRQIRHLEDFCLAANINFKWSVWQDDVEVCLIEKYKNSEYFYNYLTAELKTFWSKDTEHKELIYNNDVNCHAEYRKTYGEVFGLATDIYPHHEGAHIHIHVSEKFLPYVVN